MKYIWLTVLMMLVSGSVFADDENQKEEKKENVQVESKATATVTVVTVDDEGNVVSKSVTTDANEDGSGKLKQFKVVADDGKKMLFVTLPDGTTKTIDLGKADGESKENKVMVWTFKGNELPEGADEKVAEALEKIKSRVGEMEIDINIDSKKMADELKRAIINVAPFKVEGGDVKGEMVLELGHSAVIVSDDEESSADGEKPTRKFQVRRISQAGDGMATVLSKLEELSKRIEKIESKLDEIAKGMSDDN